MDLNLFSNSINTVYLSNSTRDMKNNMVIYPAIIITKEHIT